MLILGEIPFLHSAKEQLKGPGYMFGGYRKLIFMGRVSCMNSRTHALADEFRHGVTGIIRGVGGDEFKKVFRGMTPQVSKLTDAQYETVCNIGKNLRDRYLVDDSISMGRVREWIEWLYHGTGRPKPKFFFALNPTLVPTFQDDPNIMAATLERIKNERGRYISEKYAWNIREWMYRVIFDQRYRQLQEAINRGQNLWMSEQTSGRVWLNPASFYAAFTLIDRTAAWVADAYCEIDPRFPKSEFYIGVADFSKLGLFGITAGESECWALRLPSKVTTHPVHGILHSDNSPAIVWKDGYEQYYLNGVLFQRNQWHDVVKGSLRLEDIQHWQNKSRTRAALYYLGPQFLLTQCRARLIHKTASGNQLYCMGPRSFPTFKEIKILVYSCPSTGREYQKFVPEWLKDADEAQAWRHGMSKDEYLGLKQS
jgi:hypothetical protein